MTRKQLYLIGGISGLILILLVAMISYYRARFKQTESELFTEQANLATCRGELKKTQQELRAKKNRIEILEGIIEEIQQDVSNLSKAKAEVEAEKQKLIEEKKRREEEYQDLVDSLQQEIQNQEITITELQGKLTVNLMDKILFDSGKAKIKPEGERVLNKIAENFLQRYPDRAIRIEGYTDNIPISNPIVKKRFPTNWELSAARAIAAVRYLHERAGIDPTRLAAVGYGQHYPIDTNNTLEGRARNRRIEIIVMPPKNESL